MLDARVQRPPESLVHLAAQRDQAAPKGAARLGPLNLQGLAHGTGGILQHVVLPDLGFEHRLHYDRGLGCSGDLLLQLYANTTRIGLGAKEDKPNRCKGLQDSPSTFSF